MFSGKDEHWNEDVFNANFVEPCMNKARKCMKQDNSQNLSLGCFLSKMASVEDKNFPYRTYSQIHRKDKYSEHSSIIWPVWPNGWVFVYQLSGSGFKSSCSHLCQSLFCIFQSSNIAEIRIQLKCIQWTQSWIFHRKGSSNSNNIKKLDEL